MPQKSLTDSQLQEAIDAFTEHGNVAAAARALGMNRLTLQHRVSLAKSRGLGPGYGKTLDKTVETAVIAREKRRGGLLRKVLIIPDTHRPFHDKRAWALMLKAARGFKPDIIVVQGDLADFYSVSSHNKSPDRVSKLKSEVADVNRALDELDGLGAYEKYFVAGNHENRLERYIEEKAPELFGMVDIPELFHLARRGWKYTPYKQDVQIGKLFITHDCGVSGANANAVALNAFQHSVSTAHTHRIGLLVQGNAAGEAHVSASFGWLGDATKTDYMHRIKAARDWALGFGVGYLAENGFIYLQPAVIVAYTCVVEGVLYRG